MYIPDEWEPAEWDEITGKHERRFKLTKKSGRCIVPMGASGERGTQVYVPDMPGELDGYGDGTATALREPEGTACLVVQSPAQEEIETPPESRPRSAQAGFFSPLPETTEADEENTGLILEDSRGIEGHGFPHGVRGALATAETSGKVHAGAEGI